MVVDVQFLYGGLCDLGSVDVNFFFFFFFNAEVESDNDIVPLIDHMHIFT